MDLVLETEGIKIIFEITGRDRRRETHSSDVVNVNVARRFPGDALEKQNLETRPKSKDVREACQFVGSCRLEAGQVNV